MNTKRKIFFGLCMLLPLLFHAQTKGAADTLNILTLGDSNGTFPYSWPKQVQDGLSNAHVFNISKSGRTIGFLNLGDSAANSLFVIDENLRKEAEHTKGQPYDFIVLELGTNDAKAIFSDRQKEVPGNLEKLIQKIRSSPYLNQSCKNHHHISPTIWQKSRGNREIQRRW